MPPSSTETSSHRETWRRISGESTKAYEAFRRFRDAGPTRSLAGARAIERRWSWRWRWAERATEWDTELWRRQDEATLLVASTPQPLDVVEPGVELDDPWAGVVKNLAGYA